MTVRSSLSRACGTLAAVLALAATMVVASPAGAQAPAQKPNILFIMADDIG
jgi:arylsulfatase